MTFAELHQQSSPLLLANVWDAASARAAEAAGYAAQGTSSAAIADMLGYADGEGLSFVELLEVVTRIRAVSTLPLSVDMEAGYGETAGAVVQNLLALAAQGVVGINLEDSVVVNGQRSMLEAEVFGQRLQAIRQGLQAAGVNLFINVRTEAYLLGLPDALEQTLARGQRYGECGADGLFVPGIIQAEAIRELAARIAQPLNVMCMPGLPTFPQLAALGVKRISMGNFLHGRVQQTLQQLFATVRSEQSFHCVFEHAHHG
ncbi:isocitrate lyase/PEP mutase family protein [Leeia aquatica]|uniref:Isocitrate lyase/phosphoenolpyruvate mutase family protein n=1 Tax=Leeia aquatica TaxID=2725557 RepID=A0A847SEV2_9NEIS|nr:isocitrate lyase/phosphoenolpyruvate mutase family protein [Leeia aquatica]NLR75738.1 isocitrate lyase/phosphoenolpyruvate mutase family protein [Leeia aquatica]